MDRTPQDNRQRLDQNRVDERRRRDERSYSAESQTRKIDGTKLTREVIAELELRRPTDREHIASKILQAQTALELLRQREQPTADHDVKARQLDPATKSLHQNETYQMSVEAGRKGLDMPATARDNPELLEGYIKGLETHKTDLHITRDVENMQVPQTNFERANQLLGSAKAIYDKLAQPNLERQNLEVKSDGPELGH